MNKCAISLTEHPTTEPSQHVCYFGAFFRNSHILMLCCIEGKSCHSPFLALNESCSSKISHSLNGFNLFSINSNLKVALLTPTCPWKEISNIISGVSSFFLLGGKVGHVWSLIIAANLVFGAVSQNQKNRPLYLYQEERSPCFQMFSKINTKALLALTCSVTGTLPYKVFQGRLNNVL